MKKHGVTYTVVRAMAHQLHNQAHFLFQLIGEEQHSLAHIQAEASNTRIAKRELAQLPTRVESAPASDATIPADWLAQQTAGGPPAHWLQRVQQDAPTLLTGTGAYPLPAVPSSLEPATSFQPASVALIRPTEPLMSDPSAQYKQTNPSEQPTNYQLASLAQVSPTEPLTSDQSAPTRGKQPSAIRRVLAPFWPTRQRNKAGRAPSEQAQTRVQSQPHTTRADQAQQSPASQTEPAGDSAALSEHVQGAGRMDEQPTLPAVSSMLQPTMPAIPTISRTHSMRAERAWNVDTSHEASHVTRHALASVPVDGQTDTDPWPSLPSATTLPHVATPERVLPSNTVQADLWRRTPSEEPKKQTAWPLTSQAQPAQAASPLTYGSEQWPELPDESPTTSQDWRSIQQAWQHQQRLDDEQRGNLWNA